ncbi:OLC1v1012483C3 [Oldenlandia corymbosa var. corymbosa]|nr:OLC1v1012483C3 [Oldenlandia corymbosa var. corymbosa]
MESASEPPPRPAPAPAKANSSSPSIFAVLKAYSVPLILFVAALFFQLVVTPRSFPPTHYNVLGVPNYASIEEVTEAYEKLVSQKVSTASVTPVEEMIKARYALELLTNEIWKRDYDNFEIDEQSHVINKIKDQYADAGFSGISGAVMEPNTFDPVVHSFGVINSDNYLSQFRSDKALLIQVYSIGSNRCANFSDTWKRIVALFDGVANTGMVELGDVRLAAHLAEKKSNGRPFFRNGLPTLLAFPLGCSSPRCLHRYSGELSVDAVADWFATTILGLPRILYYSKETMVPNFLAKVKPHKVRVIFFSKTGERASPFIRQAAKTYGTYAAFAFTLWTEDDSTFWWNTFGVESAPAIVFLKDPGVKPFVYHGSVNNSKFVDIMEKNKYQVLPQLRSVTASELGCDARGYSRAGSGVNIWYCVILAGRMSQELNAMRETMRRVQETLNNNMEAPAALAMKQKRLTLTWLDGEAQQKYCLFCMNSEDSYETCGSRKAMIDVPRLLIVRYERNETDDVIDVPKKPRNLFEALNHEEADPASQLVAKYKGSNEVSEIINWISKIIEDGDSRNLPAFKTKSPELVPEDAESLWSAGPQKIVSSSKDMKQGISGFLDSMHDIFSDPRIGPFLLLGALMLFGRTWLRRSQPAQKDVPNPSNPSTDDKERLREKRRTQPRNSLVPPSMTDVAPELASQIELSDSDSD